MSACSNPMQAPPAAERILVIRLGAFGDVVRTLPAVARLRARVPGARISWLVEPSSAGVVALSPAVDDVLVFPRSSLEAAIRGARVDRLLLELRSFLASLRAPGFDLVVDFHGILKSGALSWLSGAATRVGYAPPFGREGSWLAATHRARLDAVKLSRFDRNDALVDFLGGPHADESPAMERRDAVRVPAAARQRVTATLAAAAGSSGGGERGDERPGVVLHPGTSRGTRYKRWRPERFAALARRLRNETGAVCLVTCGPDAHEAALAREIVEASRGAAHPAPLTRNVADLAALLEMAPAVVAADSGPLHLAALLGTPVVQILGPTDAVENAPYRLTPSRVVRVPLPCSPCRRGCGDVSCMEAVSVAAVADAIRGVLGDRADAARWPPWRAA